MDNINFFKALYQFCEGNTVEFRYLPCKKQVFRPLKEPFQLPAFPANENIYFGVATRNGGGDKDHIVEIPAAWVDIDFKQTSVEDANERIKYFPLQPSITIASGGGIHGYWIFKEPLTKSDTPAFEILLKRLAIYFSADMGATDASRILRVPGTYNFKPEYDPPREVKIATIDGTISYEMDDFDNHLPELPKEQIGTDGTPKNAPGWQDEALTGVKGGSRHATALKLAARWAGKGLSDSEIKNLIISWNQENNPPKPELSDPGSKEIVDILSYVRKTSNKHPRAQGKKKSRGLTLDELESKFSTNTEWVWRKHFPEGQPIIFNGREGLGKTTNAQAAAKEILNENPMGSIVWLATEGKVLDTVKKMKTIGLTERFYVAQKSDGTFKFNFQWKSDVDELDNILTDLEKPILCAFVDSIRGMSPLGDNDDKIGGVMHRVNALVCDKYHAALVYIDHWTKGKKDDLLDRNVGTTAKTAAVSAVLSIVKKTEYTRVIKCAKSNIGPIPDLISYQVNGQILIRQPYEETEESIKTRAEAFLLELGARQREWPAVEVFRLAEEENISEDTLRKVKKTLGIRSDREPPAGSWVWYWPL